MGAGASAGKTSPPLIAHMRMLFAQYDTDMSGELNWEEFWKLTSDLELGLTDDEIAEWQQYADKDLSGTVKWSEFEPMVGELLQKLFSNRSFEGEDPWRHSMCEGRGYRLNMDTGDNEWTENKPMNPHLQHMYQLFEKHDANQSGELEWDEFWEVLNELGLDLSDKDIAEWQQFADADQNGSIKWSEFEPMAEELTKQFYQAREFEGEDPWVSMTDLSGNSYMLNKKTGEVNEKPAEPTEDPAPDAVVVE